jgi:nucleoside-diphosphate-sugar epimerase
MTKKKILIIGNLGYIGPVLTNFLRESRENIQIFGYDVGFFADDYNSMGLIPESLLDAQWYGDVRTIDKALLRDVDHIIYLAAISNDPMGNLFETPTYDINWKSCISIAKRAAESGVRSFVFASSCSVYGTAENTDRIESSELNPLTPYANSKVNTEKDLEDLATEDFKITCLRFATAAGPSPRLRLDLVLNDFVMSAYTTRSILILSDGSPWRPLIDVRDMSRAMDWAITRKGDPFLIVNTGSNEWNYQIKDLAYAVRDYIGNVGVEINENAQPDKRSYKVSFEKLKSLAPEAYPQVSLEDSILGVLSNVKDIGSINDFRKSRYIRLHKLQILKQRNIVDDFLKVV